MESIHQEEDSISRSSGEVIVGQLSEQDDVGVGRSYECFFCKRGFNTAQALGGHMNIHRKDRARNKPITSSPINSSKQVEDNSPTGGIRFCQQIWGHQPQYYATFSSHHEPQPNFPTYFPASTTTAARPLSENHNFISLDRHDMSRLNNPFEDDWTMGRWD